MPALPFFLALLASLSRTPDASMAEAEGPSVRVVELKLEPTGAGSGGQGPSCRVEHEVERAGTLFAWALSSDLDLALRVEDAAGALLGEDEDSGGGTTPWLALELAAGARLGVVVTSRPGAAGSCALSLVFASESDQTRAAAEKARATARSLAELAGKGGAPAVREALAEAASLLAATPGSGASAEIARAFDELAYNAVRIEPRSAANAWTESLAFRERTRPPDHADVEKVRLNLALALRDAGDPQRARALQQRALDVLERTHPEDHELVLGARSALAKTSALCGDNAAAVSLYARSEEILARLRPEEDPQLQAVRGNLAASRMLAGDLWGSIELFERLAALRARTLPAEHPALLKVQLDLADVLRAAGELERARELEETIVAVRSRTLADHDPELQRARENLAMTLHSLGEHHRARELLQKVVGVRSRTLPETDLDLARARSRLAILEFTLGDALTAHGTFDRLLRVLDGPLPATHVMRLALQENLASTSVALGDWRGATELYQDLLELRRSTLEDDHPALLRTMQGLANCRRAAGDLSGALALEEEVLALRSRRLAPEHPDVLAAHQALAATLLQAGDAEAALAHAEKVLAGRARTMAEDHPDLAVARGGVATALALSADFEGARRLQEQALEAIARALPGDDARVQTIRRNLLWTCVHQGDAARARELAFELAAGCRSGVVAGFGSLSPRALEDRVELAARELDTVLSIAGGAGGIEREPALVRASFDLTEALRAAAWVGAWVDDLARSDPELRALREAQARQGALLARLARSDAGDEELASARRELERLRRESTELAMAAPLARERLREPSADALAATLAPDQAVVAYRRYARWQQGAYAASVPVEDHLLAHVLRSDGKLERVDLGTIAALESTVDRWRASLGVAGGTRGLPGNAGGTSQLSETAAGARVRALVFDPLLPALGDVSKLVVVPDDALHAMPFDALPIAEERLGDRYEIELAITLRERLWPRAEEARTGTLVALGGADFSASRVGGREPADAGATPAARPGAGPSSESPADGPRVAEALRSSRWADGFSPLPATIEEVRGAARLHREAFGDRDGAIVLEAAGASRSALESLAPRARFLHLATHGWFGAESIASRVDAVRSRHDASAGEEAVPGLSPMLLCGLALAGASSPPDELGRVDGLLTAEELASFDLSACELAVLSACDTNVGIRRAGQGVASLQKALHLAGARSVITSSWKVSDQATRDLMLDFYRRVWVEKTPKARALWEAKRALRERRDAHGVPLHATRDWAAWVLTGAPD